MEAPMTQNDGPGTQKELLDSLLSLGAKAFDPNAHRDPTSATTKHQFENLVQRKTPLELIPVLNILIRPGQVPEWLRAEFIGVLAKLPLREDGVRATLEFVFSVHPSSAASSVEATAPQKQGANITHEALKMATRLLASPSATISAEEWFSGISSQLLSLLDGHDGLELAKVSSYVIGFGILGRKSYGAPGKPGWVYFAEPMLNTIDPAVYKSLQLSSTGEDNDEIIDLRRNSRKILVSAEDLSQGLRRLQTLIISHPNPGLTRRLLGPILLPLWSLSSWPKASRHCEEDHCLPARNLLKIYLRISTAPDKAVPVVRNLLYNGSHDPQNQPRWIYQVTEDGTGIRIVSDQNASSYTVDSIESRWSEIGPKADTLLDLLDEISSDNDDITSIFLDLLGRWLSARRRDNKSTTSDVVFIKEEVGDDDKKTGNENQLSEISEGTILQKIMERFPEKLAGRPDQILELVSGLLGGLDETALAEDETVPIILSLLNVVITSPGFRRGKTDPQIVQSIEASLEKAARLTGTHSVDDTAKTAKNLLLFLKFRDEIEDPNSESTEAEGANAALNRQRAEDRKTYNLAMSYIMQADSPPPVRSEGLNLIQGLIQSNSPILDIPALLVLMSSLLDENEDYVNLRVIKIFTLMANRHPKSTTQELLDNYVDANETKKVDTRLRFGEALLQVIQRLGITFTGETAQLVGQALLETAGRRGHRPKTEARQARDEKLKQMKESRLQKEPHVDDAGDGDEDEGLDKEEEERNEILGRIVEGWGSKRGSEDVRIRASALSILASAIDTSVAGLGPTLTSGAVDLCLHVLTMEPELEKSILRRAAIVLVLSFVRALHAAREANQRLGFGLTEKSQADILRILGYVADTDEDGLVKQHAVDVIESLENWKIASLLPAEALSDDQPGLNRLAGLSINPTLSISEEPLLGQTTKPNKRPRIEEVE